MFTLKFTTLRANLLKEGVPRVSVLTLGMRLPWASSLFPLSHIHCSCSLFGTKQNKVRKNQSVPGTICL